MPESPSKKDVWDRLTSLATILVPAAIALAGYFISNGMKEAELTSQERLAAQSQSIAVANTKIAQANLINTMIKSLTSPDAQERKLAVQAVLIALPEQGPVLVRTVAEFDQDPGVKVAARNSLDQRIGTLIRDLYSDSPNERVAAAQDIIQGWREEPDAVKALVDYAAAHPENSNGIYNTIVVLNDFAAPALEKHKQQVLDITSTAKTIGPKTEAKAKILEGKFRG